MDNNLSPRLRFTTILLGTVLGLLGTIPAPLYAAQCAPEGSFVNPILATDWTAIFPIKLGEEELSAFGDSAGDTAEQDPGVEDGAIDGADPTDITAAQPQTMPRKHADPVGWPDPLCCCATYAPIVEKIGYYGLRWKLWIPTHTIDITRTPGCFPTFGGLTIPIELFTDMGGEMSSNFHGGGGTNYQAHFIAYPVLQFLQLFEFFTCPTSLNSWPGSQLITVEFMTELDPTWNFDVLSLIIQNPEALLFANPVAMLACAADCLIQTLSPVNNAADALFWCSGCWGQNYPWTGTQITDKRSAVIEGKSRAAQFIAKMHRNTFLWTAVGDELPCPFTAPTGMWRKSWNILQQIMPVPQFAEEIGRIQTRNEVKAQLPIVGEDFAYMLWRKQDCCLPLLPCVGPLCLEYPICFI